MSLWRFGRGWSEATMRAYLEEFGKRPVNFDVPIEEMEPANGWTVDGSEKEIGYEPPGPPEPGGLYERARQAVMNYDFSDPKIIVGHFDPRTPFVGRNILLELKVMGFRYLSGCRVHSVREEDTGGQTLFGFRYDTLEGHIERGYEWFLLWKDHKTGEIRFKIEAHWRLGDFPNWWSKLGFWLFGQRYRSAWRDHATQRLRDLAKKPVEKPVAAPGRLAHRGDDTPARTGAPASRAK